MLAKQVLAALGKRHSSAPIKKIVAKNTSLKPQVFHSKNVKTQDRQESQRESQISWACGICRGCCFEGQRGRRAKKKARERKVAKTVCSETTGQTAQSGSSLCGRRVCFFEEENWFGSLVSASAEAPDPPSGLHIASNTAMAANSCTVKIAAPTKMCWLGLICLMYA